MSKLQVLRKLKGMSQNDLALASGVKKRAIQTYEINQRPIDGAGLDILIPLALTLECKISDLLEDDDLVNKCLLLGI